MTTRSRFLRPYYLLWLAVPLLFVWALHGISWSEVWAVLARLSLTQILFLVLANGLVLLTLSLRWWLILRAQGYFIPYLSLMGYRLAGFGLTYFTPGPQFGGEPLQVYLVQRRHQVPRSHAIAAVTLDKLLELLANFAFLAGGAICVLSCQVFHEIEGRSAILFVVVLVALPAGLLAAIWAGRHPASSLLRAICGLFPQRCLSGTNRVQAVQQVVRESEEQATRFCRERPLTVVHALGFSLLSWLAMVGEYWLALNFLGQHMTLAQTVSSLTAARIAFLLPLPAGLGSLEASQVLALGAMGMDPAAGISLSLLIRLRDVTLAGLGLAWGSLKGQLL